LVAQALLERAARTTTAATASVIMAVATQREQQPATAGRWVSRRAHGSRNR
jgi:hypothetical protein